GAHASGADLLDEDVSANLRSAFQDGGWSVLGGIARQVGHRTRLRKRGEQVKTLGTRVDVNVDARELLLRNTSTHDERSRVFVEAPHGVSSPYTPDCG